MARRLLGLLVASAALVGAGSRGDGRETPTTGRETNVPGGMAGASAGMRFQVDRVPVNIFAEAMLRRVSSAPFLLCDAVLKDQRQISLRLEPYQLTLQNVRLALATYGYRVTEKGGVVYVCDASAGSVPAGSQAAGASPVYRNRAVAFQEAANGPVGLYDAPGMVGGPQLPVAANIPLGSPLTPPQAAPAYRPAAYARAESELAGYRPDYVSPAALLEAVQPVFPEVKFSVVQGDGQRPALFASGPREDVARFKEMAAYLDRAPDAVEVQAIVLEVTDGGRTGFGVSMVLDALKSGVGLRIAGPEHANQLTFHSGSFDGVLSAVSDSANVRVVSSPRLRGRAGEKLRLQVGADVPTLGAVIENPSGSTAQSIQYRSSGVIFEVTPSVLGKRIGLAIHQELSAFAETETGVSGSPTLSTRSLDTSLDLETGEWAVIGGLTSSEDQVSRQSIFGLVPIGKTRTQRKSELVLLVNVRRVDRQSMATQ